MQAALHRSIGRFGVLNQSRHPHQSRPRRIAIVAARKPEALVEETVAALVNAVKAAPDAELSKIRALRSECSSKVLAIDVEYSHFKASSSGQQLRVPAEVSIVDLECRSILHAYCKPAGTLASNKWTGGVPLAKLASGQSKQAVTQKVATLIRGAVLVGLGIEGDLKALGLVHPPQQQRELQHLPRFRRASGNGRSLRDLAKQFLKRNIQQQGSHSAREDARAVMELYLQQIGDLDEAASFSDKEEISNWICWFLCAVANGDGKVNVVSND